MVVCGCADGNLVKERVNYVATNTLAALLRFGERGLEVSCQLCVESVTINVVSATHNYSFSWSSVW